MGYIMGIDPGANGAVILIQKKKDKLKIFSHPLKATEHETGRFFETWHEAIDYGFLEQVAAIFGSSARATFSFGRNYGFIRGMLHAYGIPFEEVSAKKWRKEMGCVVPNNSGKGAYERNKKAGIARAQQLFPHQKVTAWKADGLLIAEFGRRVLKNR